MRDSYFQFLLLITSLPPSLLCKCCINFLARKGVTLLCFGFHASVLPCRQESLQYSSNVDKLGNFEDPVSLGPRGHPWRCAGCTMENINVGMGTATASMVPDSGTWLSALSYRKMWMKSIDPAGICLD